MRDFQKLKSLNRELSSQWKIEPTSSAKMAELEALLSKRLIELISTDFERLVQVMYRMDVKESKFASAMAQPDLESQAGLLARIVIEREMARIETRIKYSQGKF